MFKSKNTSYPEKGNLTACLSGIELLQQDKFFNRLIEIRSLVSCPDRIFRKLYLATLYHLAEFCQAMPFTADSFNHLHGFLDRQLCLAITALKFRRGILLPKNASTEQISLEEAQWTYAIFTASLLRDLHQLQFNRIVSLHNSKGNKSGTWMPLTGSPSSKEVYYKMEYVSENNTINVDILMAAFSGRIIPTESIDWLSENPYLFKQWWNVILHNSSQESEIEKIVALSANKANIPLLDKAPQPVKQNLQEVLKKHLIENAQQSTDHIFRINEGLFLSNQSLEDFLSEMNSTSKNTLIETLTKDNWLIHDNKSCYHKLYSKKYEDKRILSGIIVNADLVPEELQQLPISTLFQKKSNMI